MKALLLHGSAFFVEFWVSSRYDCALYRITPTNTHAEIFLLSIVKKGHEYDEK